jgi:cytochrome c553
VVGVLAGTAVLSVVLFAGAVMAWSPYLDFTLHRDVDARSWAALEPTYATAAMCTRCHATEFQKATSAKHVGIGCESCHGPLLQHALTSPDVADDSITDGSLAIAVPTDDVCVRCHVQADGRPATLLQIVPGEHYVSDCLQCHDPHTGISRRPPIVEHPLANLPPCLTCHGPEGFKTRNQRHPAGSSDDKPCLDCHAPDRGPDDDRVSE